MRVKVKLGDIIEDMAFQSVEHTSFLNVKTGEVVFVSHDNIRKADDGDFDDLEGLDDEEKVAIDVVENWENYTELPTSFDINEYQMIEDFCYRVKDGKKRNILFRAIKGKGAFRRFKDNAFDLGLIEDWYTYRDECYKQIAIDFCEGLGLDYVE
ncbi:UPF0158 family protein [Oceanobacillus bengalensis]|uniref:Uncharacterized protein n=1 Tax=Oceanobacillus bengalensis TaxID=1435466 RepID=A0A494Z481_9BACI|nr:UPF0158 family protein [Oceanobacillus bengalensis]RKQ16795.1 hypothetical protein D8M05_05960 [Oceanobacillus bengalensis]